MRIAFLILLALILGLFALGMSSCAGLAGTTLSFGENGVTITPPPGPITIPLESLK